MNLYQSILIGFIAGAVRQVWASRPWRKYGGKWKDFTCKKCFDTGYTGFYESLCTNCNGAAPYARNIDNDFYALYDSLAEEI